MKIFYSDLISLPDIIFCHFPINLGWVRKLRLQLQQHQLRQARERQRPHRSHGIIQLRRWIRSTPACWLRRWQLGIPRHRNQLPNHRCHPRSPQTKALLDRRSLCCSLCRSLRRCPPCHSHCLGTCSPGSHPDPNPVEPRPRRRLQGVLKNWRHELENIFSHFLHWQQKWLNKKSKNDEKNYCWFFVQFHIKREIFFVTHVVLFFACKNPIFF